MNSELPRDCESFAEELSHLALGELDETRRPALEQHLAGCAACRAERDLLARSVALLQRDVGGVAPILELSESRGAALLAQAAAASAAGPSAARRPWLTLNRLAAAAAVVLGATVAVNWTLRRLDRDRTQPTPETVAATPSDDATNKTPSGEAAPTVPEIPKPWFFRVPLDAKGECAFNVPGPGKWTFWVMADGYYKFTSSVDLEVGKPVALDAKLWKLETGLAANSLASQGSVTATTLADGLTPALPSIQLSVRGDDGNAPANAKVLLFVGDSPLESAEKITTGGMVGLKIPRGDLPKDLVARLEPVDPQSTLAKVEEMERSARAVETPATDPGVVNTDPGVVDAVAQLTESAPAPAPAAKSAPAEPSTVARGQAARETRTSKPTAHGGKAAPSPKPSAPGGSGGGGTYVGPEAAPQPAAEEELSRLRALGYSGGDGGGGGSVAPDAFALATNPGTPSMTAGYAFTARQQVGNFQYADETGSFVQSGGPITVEALARLLAQCNAPSQIVMVQPRLRVALGFDPNTPMDGDSGRKAEELVREFLEQLAPRQGETPRDMFFRYFGDHPFVSTRVDGKSTFGMDVDTASYNLVRAYLAQGNLPPKAAVRTEEFVNSFRHDLAPPPADGAQVFAIHDELAPSPFGESGTLLLRIGLKAREVPKSARRPVCLTFVIDVSGSMAEGGRLELVKRSLRLLVDQLDERDSIGIVVFSTDGRRVLDPTNAARRSAILAALDRLSPEGSTNADAGLRLGYDLALEQRRPDAENRVILCSDGVANTGVTNAGWLVQRIRECKSKDLYLNCVGVGMNNHNDALLEQLADEGDGFCAYVDRDEEAKEIFVDRLSGTLTTVARNAKIQVEFDPRAVRRFRQLGYENRAIAHQDFRNDRVDAGEVGAGHEVIALYELELQQGAVGPLATVRCRYEEPRSREVIEQAREIFVAETQTSIERASPRFRLSAAVAEFAEILRQSVHARSGSLGAVVRLAEPLVAELPGDPDVPEFVALVQQAARLPDLLPRRSDLARCVDEIKRARCWEEDMRAMEAARRAAGDDARDAANDELLRQLEEQNRRLEQALRDAVERAARGS